MLTHAIAAAVPAQQCSSMYGSARHLKTQRLDCMIPAPAPQIELHIVNQLVAPAGGQLPKECQAEGTKCLAVFGILFGQKKVGPPHVFAFGSGLRFSLCGSSVCHETAFLKLSKKPGRSAAGFPGQGCQCTESLLWPLTPQPGIAAMHLQRAAFTRPVGL